MEVSNESARQAHGSLKEDMLQTYVCVGTNCGAMQNYPVDLTQRNAKSVLQLRILKKTKQNTIIIIIIIIIMRV
jgi:hypothetical protein